MQHLLSLKQSRSRYVIDNLVVPSAWVYPAVSCCESIYSATTRVCHDGQECQEKSLASSSTDAFMSQNCNRDNHNGHIPRQFQHALVLWERDKCMSNLDSSCPLFECTEDSKASRIQFSSILQSYSHLRISLSRASHRAPC